MSSRQSVSDRLRVDAPAVEPDPDFVLRLAALARLSAPEPIPSRTLVRVAAAAAGVVAISAGAVYGAATVHEQVTEPSPGERPYQEHPTTPSPTTPSPTPGSGAPSSEAAPVEARGGGRGSGYDHADDQALDSADQHALDTGLSPDGPQVPGPPASPGARGLEHRPDSPGRESERRTRRDS